MSLLIQFCLTTCCSPRINDVIRRTPTAMSQDQLIQLTPVKRFQSSQANPHSSRGQGPVVLSRWRSAVSMPHIIFRSYGQWLLLESVLLGLMVRFGHSLPDHHHTLWQYVDDLLTWLDQPSAPLWSAALVILYMMLGVPFSWHKAALAQQLTWIGWSICVRTWTVQIPRDKLSRLCAQIEHILKSRQVDIKGPPVGSG